MPKLTKEFIESEIQSPVAGQRFYRDDDLPGFAIRVTKKSRSFILEKRVGGVNRRITIGKCNEMELDTAKTQVYIMLGEIAKGNDPTTGKRICIFRSKVAPYSGQNGPLVTGVKSRGICHRKICPNRR